MSGHHLLAAAAHAGFRAAVVSDEAALYVTLITSVWLAVSNVKYRRSIRTGVSTDAECGEISLSLLNNFCPP